jgi:hypothetical protein
MSEHWRIFTLSGVLAIGLGGTAFAAAGPGADGDWRRQGYRAPQALNLLEVDGDGAFSGFHRSGKNFMADVTKDGRTNWVVIDPDTNQIHPFQRLY